MILDNKQSVVCRVPALFTKYVYKLQEIELILPFSRGVTMVVYEKMYFEASTNGR